MDGASFGPIYKAYPAQVVVTFVLLVAFGALLTWSDVTGRVGVAGWVFTLAWFGALAYVGYFHGWRVVLRLELDDETLRWRTALRHGSSRLSNIKKVDPYRSAPGTVEFVFYEGRSILVIGSKGFQLFLRDLAERAPYLPISVGRMSRLQERWPGRGRYSGPLQ